MDMMELPPEIGKMLLKKIHAAMEAEDESKWVPVVTLRPEDITRERVFHSEVAAIKGKMKVLASKLEALDAERKVKHSEFWEHLYSTYSLPRDGSYSIAENHSIKKKPKTDKPCICGRCGDDE